MPPYQNLDDALLTQIEMDHEGQLQKDDTPYDLLNAAINGLITLMGHIEINVRNEQILSTMHSDLQHMQGELAALIKEQQDCPYEYN